jgi:hypothetical protein
LYSSSTAITTTHSGLARLRKSDRELDLTWNPNVSGNLGSLVQALVLSGSDLYVGGAFNQVGGQARNGLARVSTTGTGAVDPTWNPNAGANTRINALVLSGNDLYVGGDFTSIGGQTRNSLAKVATSGSGAVDATWDPNVANTLGGAHKPLINTLALAGPSLYVGGTFTSIGGQARRDIAKLSAVGNGAADPAWDPNPVSNTFSTFTSVRALALAGQELYVGGEFTSIGGQARNNLARLSTATGAADPNWAPSINAGPSVFLFSGTDVYLGGSFFTVNGQSRRGLAKLSSTGTLDPNWNPNLDGSASALSTTGSELYVGGYFNSVDGRRNTRNFAILRPTSTQPIITGFTPSGGPSGTEVTITGTDFTGVTAVSFNNLGASNFVVNSSTQITATVPTGATTGRIRVTTPEGTGISATNFVVGLPPTITSFTPTSGPVGSQVIISGANFIGITAVSFNNLGASNFVVNSSTQITATVPTGATTGRIRVTAPTGTATSASDFTVVQPLPTITSFTPTSAPEGGQVIISGTNFTGATWVSFNNLGASNFVVNSGTQITATVPPGATTGRIRVTTPIGTAISATDFTGVQPLPTITSFTPTSAPEGGQVIISGTNFTGATSVSFNNLGASNFVVNSGTQITATVPTGATTGRIRVTTPIGTAISATDFTGVQQVPTIAGFTPTSGPGGSQVIISGTNFTGATAVSFNNLGASNFVVNSGTQVTATVPTGATTGRIRVTTPGGTATSVSDFVVPSPLITTVWQPNGPVNAIVEDKDYIYLGGGFTGLQSSISGPSSGGVVFSTTGVPIPGYPSVEGLVNACIPDGNGGWYIGGEFTQVGGVTRNRLAHINPDKTLDLAWNPNVTNGSGFVTVKALALSGSDLYVGGAFNQIGGEARRSIAKLSTTDASFAKKS